MVTKKKNTSEQEAKKGRIKVGKLKLSKETVKDVNTREVRKVRGGVGAFVSKGPDAVTCKAC
jgi:hypothetical protein